MDGGTREQAAGLWQSTQEWMRHHTGRLLEAKESRVVDFKSERQFVELLHEGSPVVVAFTIRCPWTRRFDRVMESAAAEWYPFIRFVRVECPKYPGFCIARQRKDYPFVEVFHSPKPGETEGAGTQEGSVTRYSVNVLPFNYDVSPYGFREFFKIHGLSQSTIKR